MKKTAVIVVLFLAMMLSMFTGCAEKEPGPLRICLDLVDSGSGASLKICFYDIYRTLQGAGRLGEVEVEYIPTEGPERETALDRIRTEMMSGGGPDVFIINCVKDNGRDVATTREALFPMPGKTMEAGYFLPLDGYMENNTINAEWDKFPQVIMDAGRNEEGQQIIPLIYTLPAAVYRKSDWQHTASKELSWEDVLADKELYAHTALVADGKRLFVNDFWPDIYWDSLSTDPHINYVLGDLADFKQEELLFTEEELMQRVEEIVQIKAYAKQEKLYEAPDWYETYLGLGYNRCSLGTINGIMPDDLQTILPIYSDDGGVTATILSYAAVNRNTRRPEEAFTLIDYILSFSKMRDSEFYNSYLYDGEPRIPMHEDIYREEFMRGKKELGHPYYFTDENFETYDNVRKQITHAQFSDALSNKLEEMMWLADRASNAEERTEIVHNYYDVLKQMIAE